MRGLGRQSVRCGEIRYLAYETPVMPRLASPDLQIHHDVSDRRQRALLANGIMDSLVLSMASPSGQWTGAEFKKSPSDQDFLVARRPICTDIARRGSLTS
jgi:hypothetical protein